MTILPLRAIRFNPIRVGKLEDVVTQPYDKIDRSMRDAYYQKSPYNIVRVIRSREVDVRGEEGYLAAGRLWNQWLRDGILVQERDAAYFLYRQKFSIDGRSYCRHALVGLLDLNKSDRVLAHERTLSGPRTDRLKLIRQTESNDGLIFLVYRDHNQSLLKLAELAQDLVPLESVLDEYQTQNDIFRLDPSRCGEVASALEQAELIIADGHHRFSVAFQFMQECQSKNWKPAATESFDKRMVALVEMSDPGLVILPTHRVVFGVYPFHFQLWQTKMTEAFDCRGAPDMKELLRMLKDAGPGSFGVFAVDRWLLWTRKDKPHPEDLDASILQEDILAKTLGITEQQISDESRIRYFREPAKAAQDVKLGNGQLAFFLNPTRIEQVEACAHRHEIMPQKSTDFFPKMLSGLLFMKMEIDK